MKKLLTIIVIAAAINGQAQDIPNPGFEVWNEEGGPFSGYLDPADWTTLNGQTAILGITPVTRASGDDAYAGDYALRLETNFIGIVSQMAPGLCILGNIDTESQTIYGGIPINDRPNALTGWFKYAPNGVDTGEVRMTLTRWDDLAQTRDTIGVGTYYPTETTENYTFFSAPVVYESELIPDTMQVVLVSGSQFVAEEGSAIYFDELMLEYIPTGVESQITEELTVFPNPASQSIRFDMSEAEQVIAYNLYGRLVKQWTTNPGQEQLSVADLPAGQYILQFSKANSSVRRSARVVVIH